MQTLILRHEFCVVERNELPQKRLGTARRQQVSHPLPARVARGAVFLDRRRRDVTPIVDVTVSVLLPQVLVMEMIVLLKGLKQVRFKYPLTSHIGTGQVFPDRRRSRVRTTRHEALVSWVVSLSVFTTETHLLYVLAIRFAKHRCRR